jgi:hypothetical protein
MMAISLILALLFAILMTSNSNTMVVEAVAVERDALMALYDSSDGGNWRDNTGWVTVNPHRNWHGVGCDARRNVVDRPSQYCRDV